MRKCKPRGAGCHPARRRSPAGGRAIDVSAGLVFRDGKLLITRRRAGAHLGGLWEFPGGKRKPRETFKQCLARELREELGIEVAIGPVLESVTHAYPAKTVHLEFFRCRWKRHEPQPLGCPALKWITAVELGDHEFPAADAPIVRKLRRSPGLWRRPGTGLKTRKLKAL